MGSERRAEALAWAEKAEQDLLAAQLIQRPSGPTAVGCYLGQQACSRRFSFFPEQVPPRSHDLVDLHRRVTACGFDPRVPITDLTAWTDYAVAGRYPGFGDLRADQDLPPLIACATKLAQLIRTSIEHAP